MFPADLFLSRFPERRLLICHFLFSAPRTSAPPCLCRSPRPLLHRGEGIKGSSQGDLLTTYSLSYFHPGSCSFLSCYLLLHLRLPPTPPTHILFPKGSSSETMPIFYSFFLLYFTSFSHTSCVCSLPPSTFASVHYNKCPTIKSTNCFPDLNVALCSGSY